MVQKAVMYGALGNTFTIMDATAANALPPDVAATRVPAWMLPHLPATERALLRPDMLLVQGLTAEDAINYANRRPRDLWELAAIQARCKVHIVEVGYTSESSHAETLSRKQKQHLSLVHALRAAGWSVVSGHDGSPYHIMLIGVTGVLFSPFARTLETLGLQRHAANTLMRNIHVHSVMSAASLIRRRRSLENAQDNYDFQPP
jgi:hypothetical protein